MCKAPERPKDKIGLKPYVLNAICEDPTMIASEKNCLMCGNFMTETIVKMNHSIQKFNDTHARTNITMFSTTEFLRGIAMFDWFSMFLCQWKSVME